MVTREMTRFKATRSHKPGGMNRDHRSTKIHAWIKIDDLPLTPMEKKTVRLKLEGYINNDDELFAECEEERSQELNKDRALEHINFLVKKALRIKPPRIPQEPSKKSEEERIHDKKVVSVKKKARREGHIPHGNA